MMGNMGNFRYKYLWRNHLGNYPFCYPMGREG